MCHRDRLESLIFVGMDFQESAGLCRPSGLIVGTSPRCVVWSHDISMRRACLGCVLASSPCESACSVQSFGILRSGFSLKGVVAGSGLDGQWPE